MCFRTHRAQKIYSKKNFFSTLKKWGLELINFVDVPKKRNRKKYMFKICFRTHRIQKIGLKINFFFFVSFGKSKSGVILDGGKK